MSYINDILRDGDRKVRIYLDGTPVTASVLQSIHSRFPNYLNHFTITESTIGSIKTYNISLRYPGYVIPQEGGTNQGTVQRPINFKDLDFNVDEVVATPGSYDISSTGRAKVNAIAAIRPLVFTGAGQTATENAGPDNITIDIPDTKAAILNNSTQVGTVGRKYNFLGTGHSIVEDATANDRFDINLAYLPNPLNKKFGMMYGAQNLTDPEGFMAGEGLLNLPYTTINSGNEVSGGYDATHGVFRRYLLGGDDGDTIQILSGSEITNRSANVHIRGKMRFNLLEDHRFFLGFHTGVIPDGDDNFLDGLVGFGIGEQSDFGATEDTHYQILRNNGAATVTKVSSGIPIAVSTVFTFELIANNSVPNWGWNVNGGSFVTYNTFVPTTENLNFTFQLEEINTDESELDIFYLYWTQDR